MRKIYIKSLKLLKYVILLSLLIIILSTISISINTNNTADNDNLAYADSVDEVNKKLEEELNKRYKDINLEDFERFVEESGLSSDTFGTSLTNYIKKVIKGELNLSFEGLINSVVNIFIRELFKIMPMFITIIIISILCGTSQGLSSEFVNKSTNKIIYLVCLSAIIIMIMGVLGGFVSMTIGLVNSINTFIAIVFPLLLTLMTALGGVVTVAAYQPMLAILSTIIVMLITYVIIPAFIVIILFSIVGHLSDSIKLDKFTKIIKSSSEWLLGIVFSLFIAFISAQGITGMSIDRVSIKATKFAISSYVPILGGYLSEGFDLISASCVLLKNAIGISGVVCLLGLILMPIIKLIVFVIGLKLTAAIIEPLSSKKLSDMLYSIADGTMLLVVSLLGAAFMLFIVLMLIIYSFNI